MRGLGPVMGTAESHPVGHTLHRQEGAEVREGGAYPGVQAGRQEVTTPVPGANPHTQIQSPRPSNL